MSYRDVFISCTHAVNRMQSKKLSDFYLENQYAMCTCILYQIHAYENYAGHKYIYSVCISYIYSRCFHIRMVLFVVVVLCGTLMFQIIIVKMSLLIHIGYELNDHSNQTGCNSLKKLKYLIKTLSIDVHFALFIYTASFILWTL